MVFKERVGNPNQSELKIFLQELRRLNDSCNKGEITEQECVEQLEALYTEVQKL